MLLMEESDNLLVCHYLKKDGAPVSWWKGFPNSAQTNATLLFLRYGFANLSVKRIIHIEAPWLFHDLLNAYESVF